MKHTFYFQHDYNARNDPKLQRLLMKCGCDGIGIYWCIIEQLYEQGGKLPNNHIETIAFNLHTTKTIVEEVVFGSNLFAFDDDFFWSKSVLKRLENRSLISSKRSEAGKKGGAPMGNKNASKQYNDNNIANLDSSKNNQMLKKNKQKQAIKEKEIKEKEIKESTSNEVECIKAKRTAFVPPTLEEVSTYVSEKEYSVDPESFVAFYDSKGWMVGKNKMKSWKSALTTWEKRSSKEKTSYERKRHTGLSRISSPTEGAYEGDL